MVAMDFIPYAFEGIQYFKIKINSLYSVTHQRIVLMKSMDLGLSF